MLYSTIFVIFASIQYTLSARLQYSNDASVHVELPKRSALTREDGTFDYVKATKHTANILK